MSLRALALLGALALAASGCDRKTERRPPKTAAPAPPAPPRRLERLPLHGSPPELLGERRWLAVVAGPAERGRVLAVSTAGELRLHALPSMKRLWASPVPGESPQVAFARDGKTVAWLHSGVRGPWRLLVFRAEDGALAEERTFPIPPRREGPLPAGIPPSRRALGLTAAPDGHGWSIANAYGEYRTRAQGSALDYAGSAGPLRAAQDAASLWIVDGDGPRSFYGAPAKVAVDCLPAVFAVEPALSRLLVGCSYARQGRITAPLPRPQLRSYDLRSGRRLGAVDLPALPRSLAILDAHRALGVDAGGVNWVDGAAVRRTPQAHPRWDRIELSPATRWAAGIREGRAWQVLDLAARRAACTDVDLGELRPLAAGFPSEEELWILAYRGADARSSAIAVVRLPACRLERVVEAPAPLGGEGIWLSSARAFAAEAQVGGRWILHRLRPSGDRLELEALGHASSPARLAASPRGDRVLAFHSMRPSFLFSAGGGVVELKLPPTHVAAVCEERIFLYAHRRFGWEVYDGAGRHLYALDTADFARAADCREGRFVFTTDPSDALRVVDADRAVSLRRAPLAPGSRRVWAMRVLPGGKAVLVGGGPTGWQLVKL